MTDVKCFRRTGVNKPSPILHVTWKHLKGSYSILEWKQVENSGPDGPLRQQLTADQVYIPAEAQFMVYETLWANARHLPDSLIQKFEDKIENPSFLLPVMSVHELKVCMAKDPLCCICSKPTRRYSQLCYGQ